MQLRIIENKGSNIANTEAFVEPIRFKPRRNVKYGTTVDINPSATRYINGVPVIIKFVWLAPMQRTNIPIVEKRFVYILILCGDIWVILLLHIIT